MKTTAFAAALIVAAGPAPAPAQTVVGRLDIPARPGPAKTGSALVPEFTHLTAGDREDRAFREAAAGNVPPFLATLVPVAFSATVSGTPRVATLYVAPDVFSLGSDADHIRLPLTPVAAQWVADRFGAILPTRRMSDRIHAAAAVKLTPSPISASPAMTTFPVFKTHNDTVAAQRLAAAVGPATQLGALVAGHKKDVVLSPLTDGRPAPDRVAIYGWHSTNGTPIQPLSWIHESTYADYSHGIRLVGARCLIDGDTTTVEALLRHPTLHVLLSDEGAFAAVPRYQAATLPPAPVGPLPRADSFPASGRQLPQWLDRFAAHPPVAYSPAAPGGDGFSMYVRDPSGGIDTARHGTSADGDIDVSAYVRCQYRPALAADGFDRVGVFVRDDGQGMFTGTNGAGTSKGNNYALTWDGDTGRLRCNRVVEGVPTDLLPAPVYQPTTAWRRMKIVAAGATLRFEIDGATLLTATDTAHASGQYGIGYQELFATNANLLGAHADNFAAASPPPAGVDAWNRYQATAGRVPGQSAGWQTRVVRVTPPWHRSGGTMAVARAWFI